MRKPAPILLCLLLVAQAASPATVLFCPFETLPGWEVRTVGEAKAGLVGRPGLKRCLQVQTHPGTAFVTRELPIDAVKGRRVTVRCSARTKDVLVGPQACSTAKVHMAVQTPTGVLHHSARMLGSSGWHREGFTADVPKDAVRVRLNLGLEACSGQACFDTLIVRTEQRAVHRLDLRETVNASHGQIGLDAIPKGAIQYQNVPFDVIDGAARNAPDCLRLRGEGHADWPSVTSTPIRVNTAATALYILQAALDGKPMRETPCAIWTATFADGHPLSLSLFEGREIGAIGQAKDGENWRVAWRQKDKAGRLITFGVTKWTMYSETPILSLTCRSYRGASPVVLAITAVEEPPPPPAEEEEGEWQ